MERIIYYTKVLFIDNVIVDGVVVVVRILIG